MDAITPLAAGPIRPNYLCIATPPLSLFPFSTPPNSHPNVLLRRTHCGPFCDAAANGRHRRGPRPAGPRARWKGGRVERVPEPPGFF